MSSEIWTPGPYTLGKFGLEAVCQLPAIMDGLPELVSSLIGEYRIETETRIAVQLRVARLLGCPLCARFFPHLARRTGFSQEAIESALAGKPEGLSVRQFGAIKWVEGLVHCDGLEPTEMPQAASEISQLLREQLTIQTRMELLIHATGLMFLPHRIIEKTFHGS